MVIILEQEPVCYHIIYCQGEINSSNTERFNKVIGAGILGFTAEYIGRQKFSSNDTAIKKPLLVLNLYYLSRHQNIYKHIDCGSNPLNT